MELAEYSAPPPRAERKPAARRAPPAVPRTRQPADARAPPANLLCGPRLTGPRSAHAGPVPPPAAQFLLVKPSPRDEVPLSVLALQQAAEEARRARAAGPGPAGAGQVQRGGTKQKKSDGFDLRGAVERAKRTAVGAAEFEDF
jgi:hypothetical protein